MNHIINMKMNGRRKLRRLVHLLLWPSASVRNWNWEPEMSL